MKKIGICTLVFLYKPKLIFPILIFYWILIHFRSWINIFKANCTRSCPRKINYPLYFEGRALLKLYGGILCLWKRITPLCLLWTLFLFCLQLWVDLLVAGGESPSCFTFLYCCLKRNYKYKSTYSRISIKLLSTNWIFKVSFLNGFTASFGPCFY